MRRASAIVALAAIGAAALPAAADAGWSRARLMTAVGIEQALSPTPSVGATPYVGPPDLSADGRYVAFDSSARNLLALEGPDVQASAEGAVFRRAIDGGALEVVALAGPPQTSARRPEPVAISADGRHVAFQTSRALVAADTDTQTDVYVRDMSAARTDPAAYTLASEGLDAPSLGGESWLSADGSVVLLRVGAATLLRRDLQTGASLVLTDTLSFNVSAPPAMSADGSTVVWRDADPKARVPADAFLPGEVPVGLEDAEAPWVITNELLWRRVGEPMARRVVTAGDSEDPACPPGTPLTENDSLALDGFRSPCDGPLRYYPTPPPGTFAGAALSADGRIVALETDAPRRLGSSASDILVRDMAAPGGRKATTREITRFTGGGASGGLSFSADGRTLAFTSSTDRSTLPSPTFVSAAAGFGKQNTYVADLASGTVERVTRGFDGTLTDGPATNPVLSADGTRLTFVSTATNLLFGDANGIGDVFVADRFDDTQPPLPAFGTGIGAASSEIRASEVRATWRMSATVSRGGTVLYVDARVPGAGRLTAIARATKPAKGRRTPAVIARTQGRTTAAGLRRLRLRVPSKYRAAARRDRGLPVRVTVQFRAGGRSTLTRRLDSVFRYRPKERAR